MTPAALVEVGTGHVDEQGHIDVGNGDSPAPTPDDTTDHGDTTDHAGTGDISLSEDGHTVDVGAPTVDLTGDGTNETVVLQGSDGSTVLVADADGDGTADHIIEVHSDNTVTFAVPDGHGGWVVEGSGHVDAQGNITEDSKDGAGDPGQPCLTVEDHGTTDPTDHHRRHDDPTDHTTGGTTDPTDHTTGGTTDPTDHGASGSGEDINITIQGQTYDVGHATIDSDGNGTPDTAVVQGQDGSTMLVTDANGDGTGDQVIEINADGTATVAVSDGHGGWETVATGHVDSDGNLVIDQQTGGTPDTTDHTGGTTDHPGGTTDHTGGTTDHTGGTTDHTGGTTDHTGGTTDYTGGTTRTTLAAPPTTPVAPQTPPAAPRPAPARTSPST